MRSNEEGKIGFLKIENRICVALSRAKKGFYCIGNLSMMAEQSELWSGIVEDMRAQGNVGEALTLTCQNHPNNKIQASCDQDFRKAPEGGCQLPCNTRLDCGHVCEKVTQVAVALGETRACFFSNCNCKCRFYYILPKLSVRL